MKKTPQNVINKTKEPDQVDCRGFTPESDTAIQRVQALLENLPDEMKPPDPSSPRGKILASARESFADNGFNGTSTRMIAEGAGVNLAMIHYYFGSKETLYNRVLMYEIISLFIEISSFQIAKQLPEERLVSLPLELMNSFRNNPLRARILRRELGEGARNFVQIIGKMGEFGPQGFRQIIHEFFQMSLEKGKVKDLPRDSVLRFLMAVGYSTVFLAPVYEAVIGASLEENKVWEEQLKVIEQIVKYGLFRKEAD